MSKNPRGFLQTSALTSSVWQLSNLEKLVFKTVGFLSIDSIQDYINLTATIAFITKKDSYKKWKNLWEYLHWVRWYFLKHGWWFCFFFWLTTNILFCRHMSYQTRENDQKPVTEGHNLWKQFAFSWKTRMMKQIKLLLSKAIKELLELHFRQAIKSLATRSHFRENSGKTH